MQSSLLMCLLVVGAGSFVLSSPVVPAAKKYAAKTFKCGQTPVAPELDPLDRIVGGVVARPYSWPWQVAFYDYTYGPQGNFHAAGSLISDQWILTAAHVAGSASNKSALVAKMGVFEHARRNEEGEAIIRISRIVIHPKYTKTNNPHDADVALVKLESPVKFTNHIQPVCLPLSDKGVETDAKAYVTGWGLLKEFGSGSPVLRQVGVKTVSNEECTQNYATKGGYFNGKLMMCAASPGKDSCQNDSGGPMVIKAADGAWYEHGVVSWGAGCARPDAPGVYARTTAFCDFIKETTEMDLC